MLTPVLSWQKKMKGNIKIGNLNCQIIDSPNRTPTNNVIHGNLWLRHLTFHPKNIGWLFWGGEARLWGGWEIVMMLLIIGNRCREGSKVGADNSKLFIWTNEGKKGFRSK